jgi:hypothetical protein
MIRFNPLDHPLSLAAPHRLTLEPAWQQHIPFAFTLVDMLRPRLFVELGTYRGDSFCAFCQAVSSLQCATTCVAVDSWLDDMHVGAYGNEVYEELLSYQREHYGGFSSLLRMTFDEAVSHFEDTSIDLLHIDGTHTYEAVRHDFDQWIGKMSNRGVVLLHDVREHLPGFGVFRLWKELKQQYPTCEFAHGHGLGIVAVGAEVPEGLLRLLQEMNTDSTLARYFQIMGERIARMQNDQELVALLKRQLAETRVQHDEMVTLREKVESLEVQASFYAGELALLERERQSLERQCHLLQISVTQYEAEAAHAERLRVKVAELEAEIQQRCRELSERNMRVAELETEVQERHIELKRLRSSRTFRTALLMQRPMRGVRRLLGQHI